MQPRRRLNGYQKKAETLKSDCGWEDRQTQASAIFS
jgi:hypothetical protein